MELNPGDQVDGLTVMRRLGSGGSGIAYLVHNPRIDRYECMKVYRSTRIEDADNPWHEARAAGSTGIPGIITVFSAGQIDTSAWYTMEYSALGDLRRAVLSPGDFSAERSTEERRQYQQVLIPLLREIAEALDSLHNLAEPIVHGDVKPENILVFNGSNGKLRAKLSDFGLAATVPPLDPQSSPTAPVSGTLPYLAPERFQGSESSPASDRYAFSCTAFEMLTGIRPFSVTGLPSNADNGTKISAYRSQHFNASRPTPEKVDTSLKRTNGVFSQALAIDAGSRYPTATKFVEDLELSLGLQPAGMRNWTSRKALAAGVAVLTILAISVPIYLITPPADEPLSQTTTDERPTLGFIGQGCPSHSAAGAIISSLQNSGQNGQGLIDSTIPKGQDAFPNTHPNCRFGGTNTDGFAGEYLTILYIFNSPDLNTQDLKNQIMDEAVYNPGTISEPNRINLGNELLELTSRYAVDVYNIAPSMRNVPSSTCSVETMDGALTVVQINYDATREGYAVGDGVTAESFACSDAKVLIQTWAEAS